MKWFDKFRSKTSEEVDFDRPSLKQAKKHKATGFGKTPVVVDRCKLSSPFGAYSQNGDGTVTHIPSGLCWIRVPWGMVWDGESFTGEPILLSWDEATKLFGRGKTVMSTSSALHGDLLKDSAFENGYKYGSCHVDFAGFTDWRLPTALELDTFAAYEQNSYGDWMWRGKKNLPLILSLYPEWGAKSCHLWTATSNGLGISWGFDGRFPVGDCQTHQKYGVVFVRETAKHQVVPPKK